MWGTTGFVFNPELVDDEAADVSACNILINPDYYKSVTVKDNVRDAYFAALSILYEDELNAINADEEMTDAEKEEARSTLLNSTDEETIERAEDILKDIKENVYSFETDSGKTDMVTGKVIANYQWSGDAVYILDQADEEDTELWYSVPEEGTNLWFDGWVMLKDGIAGDERKQTAAEAFVNFLSRPDIAVRNMYYIGYASSIAAEEVFNYFDWCYGVVPEDEGEDLEIYVYDVSYFFGEDSYIYLDMSTLNVEGATRTYVYEDVADYTVYEGGTIDKGRQAFGQYPTADVISRSVVMLDFGDDLANINQMWINVRCLDINDITGEVFFGTGNGIISYQSDASEGGEDFSDVHAYPNPVREDYHGLITITGLMKDTRVRITDVSGSVVYETVSNGGMATWDGTRPDGQRVATGVYIAMCISDNGKKHAMTKILVIN